MFPLRGAYRDVGVNATDRTYAVIATTSAYPNSDYSFLNQSYRVAVDPWTAIYGGSSSPYLAADFGADSRRQVKLVGAGLRVQYVDKVLDMGGDYCIWRNNNMTDLIPASADTLSDLLATQNAVQQRVGGDWVGVTYTPQAVDDFKPVKEPGVVANLGIGSDSIGSRLAGAILISNGSPGARYAFEFVAFYEAMGASLPLTKSHSDPQGLGAVLEQANMAPVQPDLNKALATALRAAEPVARATGSYVLRQGKKYMYQRVGAAAAAAAPNLLRAAQAGVGLALMP
jgi:hypothetical protein